MINYALIKSILSEAWAIDEQSIEMMMPMIDGLFNPNMAFEPGNPILPEALVNSSNSSGSSKNVSVITISGSLTKDDQYCGPAGMATIGNWIRKADASENVDSIVLRIDSPGGTVAGTEELGNIIKNTKKPIVAFIEDLGCSAAYWLACNADEIIANNTTAVVGSIGVLMSFADVQPMWEAKGVKFHMVTAPQSEEKTSMFDKLRAGDYAQYKNEVLKPLAEKFIGIVKANRSGLDEKKYCTGRTFFAKDVVGDLIDSIGSLDQAIQTAANLSAQSSSGTQATKPQKTFFFTMKYPKLAKAAGVESFEAIDDTIDLTAEMAEAVETALTAAETAETELAARTAELATSDQAVADANLTIQQLIARVTELEAKPGAPSAIALTNGDGGITEPISDFRSAFAEANKFKTK